MATFVLFFTYANLTPYGIYRVVMVSALTGRYIVNHIKFPRDSLFCEISYQYLMNIGFFCRKFINYKVI